MNILMIEPEYLRITQIISGGQYGADRGGLEAAKKMNIKTGGYVPLGWKTCQGSRPELADFGLIETDTPKYDKRTFMNVDLADGTVIIASNPNSPGSRLTSKYSVKVKKPFIILNVSNSEIESHIIILENWIKKNRISILNVAGNRDYKNQYYHHDITFEIISKILELK